jgi:tRNA pseudouridine38-40 synthase
MVRNIVGTLVEVGRGRLAPEDIPGILAACDRTQAGPTAPAQGLCLMKVEYENLNHPRGFQQSLRVE